MTELSSQTFEDKNNTPIWARVGAELVGSFLVCFAIYSITSFGSAIYGANLAFITIGTGLAYAVAIVLLGKASGGQFNPAVTLAAMLASKTGLVDGILYIVAQVLGGIGAGALLRALLPTSSKVTYTVWMNYAVNGFDKGSVSNSTLGSYGVTFDIKLAVIVEVIAGLVVVGAAMHTLMGNASTGRRALVMGLAYTLATAIAFPITGAGLNPARSTGIAIFAQNLGLAQQPLQQLWVFWISPILAAAVIALAMIVAQLVRNRPNAVSHLGETVDYASDGEQDDRPDDDEYQDETQSSTNDAAGSVNGTANSTANGTEESDTESDDSAGAAEESETGDANERSKTGADR